MVKHPVTIKVFPNKLISLVFSGNLAEEDLDAFKTSLDVASLTIKHQFEEQGHKVKILLDMSDFSGNYSTKALQMLADFAKEDTDYVEKSASFGGSKLVRMTGVVVLNLAGRDNIQVFETKEEALKWLEVTE